MRGIDRFALVLLALFAIVWVIAAIDPWYPDDWLLENVLVFIGIPARFVNSLCVLAAFAAS